MRVAEIGDNCIDVYERIGKKYPTGNVVDTGVNLQKLGIPVSIISTTGNDENGKWMLETLKKEGVDISHLKIGDGATAVTYMDMDGKDRVHGDYVEGVLENIVFDEEDIEFAAEHDLVHTALWGKAENTLPMIAAKGIPIAFDYADNDLDVLKTAGLAVAMGNANANVKKIADVEVMDNDHDGVAEAIYKYLLEK